MNTLTEAAVRAAGAALSRAEIHDDRVTADEHRIRAWAEAMNNYGCDDTSIACRAVDTHYSQPGAVSAKVGDIIAAYRQIRRDGAERDKATQAAATLTPPDPQLGGLPIGQADGQPIWHAYEHAYNAHRQPCSTCGAQTNQACINPITGRTRKIPCVVRAAAAHGRHL